MKNLFNKTLAIFLTLLILLSTAPASVVTNVSAADDRIKWNFDGETLVVSGTGELSEEYTSTYEWNSMYNKCVNVKIEAGITSVGKSAFGQFINLEKVEILGEITEIGKWAFYRCEKLKEINLPDSVTVIGDRAFEKCSSLDSLNIPKNIVEIGERAFKNCSGFNNSDLVLPDTIQKVYSGAFSGTRIKSLTTPFLGTGLNGAGYNERFTNHIGYMFGDEEWSGSYACYDSVSGLTYYLPQTLKTVTVTKQLSPNNFENAEEIEKIIVKSSVESTEIPDNFAKNCKSLESVVFENSDKITRIGRYAFFSCVDLEDFIIPENVVEIATYAFCNCMFNSIQLPQNLKTIGVRAFENCQNIISIVIPDGIETIGAFAFNGCTDLANVTLPQNEAKIGIYAFNGTKYQYPEEEYPEDEYPEDEYSNFAINSEGVLTAYFGTEETVVVPDGVKRIGTVFAKNKKVKNIILPDGLEEISCRAFDGCKGITELVVPESVTTINEGAFAGMCNLTKLTVPFVGKSRDVETDTREALIGYWFSSSYESHNCIYNCYGGFTEIKQIYNNTNYQRYSYKPRYFKELTVTDSVLRSNALQNYKLEVLTLGENVKGIEEYAANKLGLEELYFNENIKITEIPDYAFCNNNLTSITIPKSVKRIGIAFICDYYPDNKITEINLNEGLEVIEGSFAGSKITSINLPDSLKKILEDSFRNCTKLKSVEFPGNLVEIGDWAFEMCPILEEVIFSDSIEKIGTCAFLECPVKKVVIPESMKDIVEQTFYECEELEIVVIGGNVTEIGPNAFANCTSLGAIVIPDSVTNISDDAFENSTEQLVIYCNEGSYAEQYAITNEIKYTTLVIDPIENQVYTGEEITPVVGVSANNKRLTQNEEYSISYKDNINAGSAKVIAKGMGDFKHLAATAQFTILPRGVEDVRVLSSGAIYSPEGVKPEIYVFNGNRSLVEGQDYEILDDSVLTEVGEYNIPVSLIGNYDGVINVTYKVARRSITQTNIVYGDTVKITYQGVTLEEGKDYVVTKETNENDDVITIVEGIGNYKGTDTHTQKSNNKSTFNWFEIFINAIKRLFSSLFNIGV